MRTRAFRISAFILVILFVSSCATYYDKITSYHTYLDSGDYEKASKSLEHNKFLHRRKNQVLYLLEAGKLAHMRGDYDSSNVCFNEAGILMDRNETLKNTALTVFVNPTETTYMGEDFERVMIHYYKALNYYYKGLIDEAIVEARQITIELNRLSDKPGNETRKYKNDAFAQSFTGILYEANGNYNDAFIAYRNAYEVYKTNNGLYYGVNTPEQLKQDLLRAAYLSGFHSEVDYYEREMGIQYKHQPNAAGEVVVFWENGLGPVKQQGNIMFTMVKGAGGMFSFVDPSGTINIPFVWPDDKNKDIKPEDLGIFRIAYPKYVEQLPLYTQAVIEKDSTEKYSLELADNINVLAIETLRERFLKETATALSRLAVRKAAELSLRKENETAGAILGLASAIAEKADTRNWQSLPYAIHYARIPLNRGNNALKVALSGGPQRDTITMNVHSRRGLQIVNFCTIKHYPPTAPANGILTNY